MFYCVNKDVRNYAVQAILDKTLEPSSHLFNTNENSQIVNKDILEVNERIRFWYLHTSHSLGQLMT